MQVRVRAAGWDHPRERVACSHAPACLWLCKGEGNEGEGEREDSSKGEGECSQ